MPKPLPPRLQVPVDHPLPKTLREVYAEALKAAELEYRAAQDSGDPARYDKLSGQFPFIAAGSGDEEV